ncbi:hypothetical protein ACFWIQ_08955 [Kitasatospora sp. NPDC127059]|uniref:hypothetical protein n=1 Tax=unclassified Kitasatospora TaxID=2633591 RepID=UPI003646BFE1
MGTIKLHHANIDEAADALEQAGQALHSAMTDFETAVQTAQNELQGDLATAAKTFQTTLTTQNKEMNTDIVQGAGILREMHGLLRAADAGGAAGIG